MIKGEHGRLDVARRLLERGEMGHYAIVASTLVYAEVCGHGDVRASKDTETVDRKVDAFFHHKYIHWVEVDLPIARHARALSRLRGLRGPDAIHLASAIRAKCAYFMTWDEGFPIDHEVGSVTIRHPFPYSCQIDMEDLQYPPSF